MDWKRLKDQNKIGRTGNVAHGDPNDYIILGLDDGYSFEEVAARIDDSDRDLAILKYACKDTERLKDEIPDWFIDGFQLTGGDVDPARFWQMIDKNGKSLPLLTNGRSRCMALRIENKRRAENGEAPLVLDAIPDTFLSKNPSLRALRMKRFRNRSIPDSLAVLAETAADYSEQGLQPDGISREMGVSVDRAKDLLGWAPLFPKFCDEARRRANDGRLKLRGAKELIAKFPTKAEQEAYFSGKVALRGGNAGGPRPLSPRTLDIFIEQVTAHADRGTLALLRLARGDTGAAKDLPDELRAGWLRAQEAAKKKPRGK